MTLLISVFAAVIATVVWYCCPSRKEMRLGVLCWMFWGASLMWLVDAVHDYAERGAACFSPSPAQMLNGLFLGLSVVALALVIWLVVLLISDPKGVVKAVLFRKKK